jgi:hypothetical protein
LLLFFPLLLPLGLLSLFYLVGWFFQGDFVCEMGGSMMGTLRCGFEEMIVVL